MSLLWALPHPAQERRVAVAHAIWRHVIGRVIAVMTIGTVVLARHLRGAKIGPDCSWPFEWRIRSQYYTGRFFYNCPELVRCHRICRRVQAFYAINLSCPAKRKKKNTILWHTLSYRGILYLTLSYGIIPYRTVVYYILNHTMTYIIQYHTVASWHPTTYCITPYHTMAYLIQYHTS
jgi:hypothetical protein